MSADLSPPDGFAIGHWTEPQHRTGCTVVIAPPGSRGGVDVRGGGPGTRETEAIGPFTGTAEVTAAVFAGGSAFGLAAADGAARWLEEHERGYATPLGRVPIVPAAIVYDSAVAERDARPGPDAGYAACDAAREGVPERGRIGAGAAVAAGKVLGRQRATATGVGYAAARTGRGETVAALAVANPFGDVVAADGTLLAAARGDDGPVAAADVVATMDAPPEPSAFAERNTTLVCVMTDASLTKAACTRVARMASAGVARAVDPVFSDVDGDVAFCVTSGPDASDRFSAIAVGTVAATVTAAAIRDSVRHD